MPLRDFLGQEVSALGCERVEGFLGPTVPHFLENLAPEVSRELAERMCSVPSASALSPDAGGVVHSTGHRNVPHQMQAARRPADNICEDDSPVYCGLIEKSWYDYRVPVLQAKREKVKEDGPF